MKRLILITGILFATAPVFAQFYEITPMAGYTFSGEADNGYGTYYRSFIHRIKCSPQ